MNSLVWKKKDWNNITISIVIHWKNFPYIFFLPLQYVLWKKNSLQFWYNDNDTVLVVMMAIYYCFKKIVFIKREKKNLKPKKIGKFLRIISYLLSFSEIIFFQFFAVIFIRPETKPEEPDDVVLIFAVFVLNFFFRFFSTLSSCVFFTVFFCGCHHCNCHVCVCDFFVWFVCVNFLHSITWCWWWWWCSVFFFSNLFFFSFFLSSNYGAD